MAYSIEMWHQIGRSIKKGFGTLVETTCKRRMAPGKKLRFRNIASSQAIFCVFVESRYLGVKSALENRLLMVNGLSNAVDCNPLEEDPRRLRSPQSYARSSPSLFAISS
jgi:hypothetical protein